MINFVFTRLYATRLATLIFFNRVFVLASVEISPLIGISAGGHLFVPQGEGDPIVKDMVALQLGPIIFPVGGDVFARCMCLQCRIDRGELRGEG